MFSTSPDTSPMKNMLIISLEYTPVTNVHNLFNVCNNHIMLKLQRARMQNMQFSFYISDTPVTLKHSQGHKTWNDNVDSKEGYIHARFYRFCFNCVRKHYIFSNKEICQLCPLNMCEKKTTYIYSCIFMIYLMHSTIIQNFNLIR